VPGVTTRLGVVALAGPDNGGTIIYPVDAANGLQHTKGFDITLYGDPSNPDFVKLVSRSLAWRISRGRQMMALAADRATSAARSVCPRKMFLLAPILLSGVAAYDPKPFAYTPARSAGELLSGKLFQVATAWRYRCTPGTSL